jgi:nucleoside-diphosphate kinase
MLERSLVLLKPDAVRRGLCGEIIRRLEAKGLRIVGMKMLKFDRDLSRRHYAAHVDKPFYAALEEFIVSGPSVAMVVEGEGAIALVRALMGATNYLEAAPGTIRADFAKSTRENLVHGSDSAESAEREVGLFFDEADLV